MFICITWKFDRRKSNSQINSNIILSVGILLEYAPYIAAAEKNSANAVTAFNQVMKKATKANGQLDPSKRKNINNRIKQLTAAQCDNAAIIVNVFNSKPGSCSKNFAVLCDGLNSVTPKRINCISESYMW